MFQSIFKSQCYRGVLGSMRLTPARQFSSHLMRQPTALRLINQQKVTSQQQQQFLQNISPFNLGITSLVMSPLTTIFQQLRFASRGNRRGGNRGNTYQPSTIKRKRRLGFLLRMKTTNGRKIMKRRKLKGRWYLTH